MLRTKLGGVIAAMAVTAAVTPAVASATAPQVTWADKLVDDLGKLPLGTPDNDYGSPPAVHWAGVAGAQDSSNKSRCSSFITALLKQSFGFTNDQYKQWFDSTSPTAAKYETSFAKGAVGPFKPVKQVHDLRPGDVIAISYSPAADADGADDEPVAGDTGHAVMVRSVPKALDEASLVKGATPYSVDVIDSSKDYHSKSDTRWFGPADDDHQPGVGRGTMRVYAAPDGTFAGYSWHTDKTGGTYVVADRPMSAAHLPYDGEAQSELESPGYPIEGGQDGDDRSGDANVGGSMAGDPIYQVPTTTPIGKVLARPVLKVSGRAKTKAKGRRVTVTLKCQAAACKGTVRLKRNKRAVTRTVRVNMRSGSTKRVTFAIKKGARAVRGSQKLKLDVHLTGRKSQQLRVALTKPKKH